MRKTTIMLSILASVAILFPINGYAISFGMYAEFGSGSGEAEYDVAGIQEFDIDTQFFGVGFQFETHPITPNKVFSYRFQAGFESRDVEGDLDTTLELGGIVINNTFAFGGNVSEKIRLWGGPQVLLGFYRGETDQAFFGDELSFSGAGLGLGLAGGANFGLGGGKTVLSTTIGIRSLGFSGNAEWYDEREGLDGRATEFFLSVGIMF